jgi:hypothetical protein
VVVLWLGLSLLSLVRTHNKWCCYGWVCRCCRRSVNTICGSIMVGFLVVVRQKKHYIIVLWLLLLFISKHNMWWYYGWVCPCCRPTVNTLCVGIMVGLSLLSSDSKHNMWWYYGWVCPCCRPTVNTICVGIMVGFVLVVVRQ